MSGRYDVGPQVIVGIAGPAETQPEARRSAGRPPPRRSPSHAALLEPSKLTTRSSNAKWTEKDEEDGP